MPEDEGQLNKCNTFVLIVHNAEFPYTESTESQVF